MTTMVHSSILCQGFSEDDGRQIYMILHFIACCILSQMDVESTYLLHYILHPIYAFKTLNQTPRAPFNLA